MNIYINKIFEEINYLLTTGEYQAAVNKLLPLVEKINESEYVAYNVGGFAMDIGAEWPNENLLETGIEITEKLKECLAKDHKLYPQCCYNLGNGLSSKIQLQQRTNRRDFLPGDPDVERRLRLVIEKL